MKEDKLDALIEKNQTEYARLVVELKKVESKLESLFNKKYPNGRFHDWFLNKSAR